jgi:prepilin-type N-terminal cleavage/methylation domain-containing protein
MKTCCPRPATRGFTLLEVMFASVIMLVGIVGASTVLVSGSRMLEASRQQAIASQIIHGEMERVRLQAWDQFANGTSPVLLTDRYSAASYSSYQSVLQKFNFTCTQAIADVAGKDEYKQVTFTVSWLDHNRLSHTRQSSTVVGKNGLYVSYQR